MIKIHFYLQVRVSNLQFTVGRVEYDAPETFEFPTEAIAGIAAGGSFLLLIIILILIIYHFQSTKAERIYKKLQIQLDNLESNVRNECKQGQYTRLPHRWLMWAKTGFAPNGTNLGLYNIICQYILARY